MTEVDPMIVSETIELHWLKINKDNGGVFASAFVKGRETTSRTRCWVFFFFSTSAGPRRSVSLEVVGIHFQSAVKFRFQLLQLVFSSSQSAAGRFCTDSSLAANHD